MLHPRGPLSPRVYWTRRATLVGAIVVFALILWWLLPSGGTGASASPAHHPAKTTPQVVHHTHAHQLPTATVSTGASGSTHTGSSGQQGKQSGGGTADQPKKKTTPHLVPSGPCKADNVELAVVVKDAEVDHGTTVGVSMSTVDGSVCSLGVAPSRFEAQVTSGPATVWQSTKCADALPARNVVVGPTPRVVYSYRWNGRVEPYGCTATRVAKPGVYWAWASIVGGNPAKAAFEVTDSTS